MILIFLRLLIGYSLQMFPWAFLCGFPFRDHLRGKRNIYIIFTVFIGALGVIFASVCCILKSVLPATDLLFFCCNLVFFALLICSLLFYFYIVKESHAKKLFIFFFAATAALCSTSITNTLTDRFNSSVDFLPYFGANIPINVLVTLAIYPFLFYIIRTYYMPIAENVSKGVFRSLAAISLVLFCILAIGLTFVDYALHSRNLTVIFLYISLLFMIIFIYGIFFYILYIDYNEMLSRNQRIQLENQLKLNEAQYCRISETIENSRKMRHDLRHHMLTLQGYLKENEIDRAKTYIEHYVRTLAQEGLDIYSENAIVNHIVSHYHMLAAQQDVIFCGPPPQIPRELPIETADLSVILGNLLENALTAASAAEKGNRYINLNILYTSQILVITVDNSFAGEIKKEGDAYISQKSGHQGLGIASITSIARSYDGGVEFTHEDHVFHASVMLNLESI